MHICFIGQYPYKNQTAGGVGTFTQTLAQALVKKGIRVSVIAIYPGIKELHEVEDGVQVYWLNQQKWSHANFVRNAYKLNQLLRKVHAADPIDIVEAQEAGLAFIYRNSNIKYVIRLHGGHYFFSKTLGQPFSKLKGLLETRSFPKADAAIAVSQFVLDETSKYINIDPSKAVVIHNPINSEKFKPTCNNDIVKHQLFFAGRIVEKKGIRQLVEAMPMLIEKFPTATLEIYGGDTTIDNGESFQQQLEQSIPDNIKHHIHFNGQIKNDELPAVMAKAELCVYPSHMEAMPIAWLEVMSMGKPFIASDIGPAKEMIAEGVDGLLCDPYSPASIAEKIVWMFEHPAEARAMGIAARKKVEEQYTLEKVLQENINFFEQLIGKPTAV